MTRQNESWNKQETFIQHSEMKPSDELQSRETHESDNTSDSTNSNAPTLYNSTNKPINKGDTVQGVIVTAVAVALTLTSATMTILGYTSSLRRR